MGYKNKISEVKRFAYLPIFLCIKSYFLLSQILSYSSANCLIRCSSDSLHINSEPWFSATI